VLEHSIYHIGESLCLVAWGIVSFGKYTCNLVAWSTLGAMVALRWHWPFKLGVGATKTLSWCLVRLADKSWQKVLLADLLWEKNIAEWLTDLMMSSSEHVGKLRVEMIVPPCKVTLNKILHDYEWILKVWKTLFGHLPTFALCFLWKFDHPWTCLWDCIGAIDGTRVFAIVPIHKKLYSLGLRRKHTSIQNVFRFWPKVHLCTC
jgi:hypothetical protein